MPKAVEKSSRFPPEEEEEEEYFDEEEEEEEPQLRPSDYEGDAGQQNISYMVAEYEKLRLKQKKEMDKFMLSAKRQKGKAPSSSHPSHTGGFRMTTVPPIPVDDWSKDPNYIPVEEEARQYPRGRARGRGGRGRARGRGGTTPSRGRGGAPRGRGTRGVGARGRGRGSSALDVSSASAASSDGSSVGRHWKELELKACIFGANHLKPVLKGKFRSGVDGTTMKRLAWEELAEYVTAASPYTRSEQQCKDKLLYFGQDAKKKRQLIDAKFRSGSGQRGENDYLDELEQAILDWVGEDVTLGIPGMQPPDLKGSGERSENPWSCYDPMRPEKEDYAAMRMPSEALRACEEGDLLVQEDDEDEGTVPDTDVHDYNEEAAELDTRDYYQTNEVEAENTVPVDDAIYSPPAKTMSRQHMLKVNHKLNSQKKGPKKTSEDNKMEGLTEAEKERVKRKDELLKAAREIVVRELARKKTPVKKAPARRSLTPKPSVSRSPTVPINNRVVTRAVVHREPEQEPAGETRVRPRRSSLSAIINESIEKVGEISLLDNERSPPHSPVVKPVQDKTEKKKTYTEEEVDAMLKRIKENTDIKPDFDTSTPLKAIDDVVIVETEEPQKEDKTQPQSDKKRNRESPTFVSNVVNQGNSVSKRRRLSYTGNKEAGLNDTSLPSITSDSPDPHRRNMQDNTKSTGEVIKEVVHQAVQQTGAVLVESQKNICEGLMKNQDELAQNTQEVGIIIAKTMKGVCEGITKAVREHAQDTARSLRAQRDNMVEIQGKYIEAQNEEMKQDAQALVSVHAKLSDDILTKQVKMSQGLEKISKTLCVSAEKVAEAQQSVHDGLTAIQEVTSKLNSSVSKLAASTQVLQDGYARSGAVLEMVMSVVTRLNEAVQYTFNHNLIRAVPVRTVGTDYEVIGAEDNHPQVEPYVEEVVDGQLGDDGHLAEDGHMPEDGQLAEDATYHETRDSGFGTSEGHAATTGEEETEGGEEETEHYSVADHNVTAYLTHPELKQGQHDYVATSDITTARASNGQSPVIIPGSAIMQERTESQDATGLPSYVVKKSDEVIIMQSTSDDNMAAEGQDGGQSDAGSVSDDNRKPMRMSTRHRKARQTWDY